MRRAFPLFTTFALLACGTAETVSDAAGELRLLTYNVHGLPAIVTGDDTAGRMPLISPALAPYDIIGIQEDFDSENHRALIGENDHEDVVWFDDRVGDDRVYGSGLTLMSRIPIAAYAPEHYAACHGVLEGASDCLASKGFQVATVVLAPGIEVDVYNTHMEAGGGVEDNVARGIQVAQLVSSLQGRSAGKAVIFLGDTNLHGGDPVETPHLDRLLGEGDLEDACDVIRCPEPGRIDRVLIRSNDVVRFGVHAWAVDDRFVNADGVALSDHDGISVTVQWRAPHRK